MGVPATRPSQARAVEPSPVLAALGKVGVERRAKARFVQAPPQHGIVGETLVAPRGARQVGNAGDVVGGGREYLDHEFAGQEVKGKPEVGRPTVLQRLLRRPALAAIAVGVVVVVGVVALAAAIIVLAVGRREVTERCPSLFARPFHRSLFLPLLV